VAMMKTCEIFKTEADKICGLPADFLSTYEDGDMIYHCKKHSHRVYKKINIEMGVPCKYHRVDRIKIKE